MAFDELCLFKKAVVLDPIDRIWIPRCVQPSVNSKTSSSMGLGIDRFCF